MFVQMKNTFVPLLWHESDSNQGSNYIVIFVSLIYGFKGQNLII